LWKIVGNDTFLFVVDVNPVLVSFGPAQITWAGLCVALGIAVGVVVTEICLSRRGFASQLGLDLAVIVLPVGLVVARLFHIADHWSFYAVHPIEAFTTGGASLDGAVIGGLFASMVYLRRRNFPPLAVLDATVAGTLIGIAISSVGSFVAGDAMGRAAAFGPAVIYVARSTGSFATVGTYPVALYEAMFFFFVFAAISTTSRFSLPAGNQLWLFLTAFGAGHLVFGFLRDDPVDIAGLGQAQIVGIGLAIVGILGLTKSLVSWRRGLRRVT
jgi:prolipoprotein diacylglyceryltransferase